jgi:putative addiction module CopG family antidote
MKLELDKEYESLVQRKVDSGRFASPAEVVQEALREMDQRDEWLDYVRSAIAEAEADVAAGRVYDWTPELMDQIRAEADEADRLGLPIEGHDFA